VNRSDYLALAAGGLRMPLGAHLVLHEESDPEAVILDGQRLGMVVARTARRYRTPLAIPLMDLTVERNVVLELLGVPPAERATFHLTHWPGDDCLEQAASLEWQQLGPRLQASCEAVRYIARQTDLVPIGMVIGPLSLTVRLLADPISAMFTCGRGKRADENPQVALLEKTLELATRVVLASVTQQITAGAEAMFVCEPAAGTAYISPRQLAAGADLLERLVLAPQRRIRALLDEARCELIFHCCAELTAQFLQAFVGLHPTVLSLGSSRKLWEDAALVPEDVVLYGNLPTRLFYSDEACPLEAVIEQTRRLIRQMRAVGHPFILGSECDVLSVPGAHDTICRKVDAFMTATVE